MLSFYLIWSSSYFTALWWMSRFWLQKPNSSLNQAFFPKVTLIIPFRNEVLNIPTLSESLSRLRYPNLQVLLIDDHSEDLSFQYLEKWFEGNDTVEVLSSSLPGKKAAVEFGVKRASGEIILCSDADCIFPELWVQGMVLPFQNPEIQLVAGPVMVEERRGFLPAFQSLDWASILLMSAYSFAGKKPLMCSAANLAYRKTAFQKVQGYEGNRQFLSGDDEFLMKKIAHQFGGVSCHYLSSSDPLVVTKAEASWSDFIAQRVRWASKWRAHASVSHGLSAAATFLTQVIWVGSFYLISLGGKGLLGIVFVWLVKIGSERLGLGKVLKTLGRSPSPLSFLKTSFVHPFYVLRVGIGALGGKISWKGRSN